MKDILERIKYLVESTDKDFYGHLIHTMEELGEVSKEHRKLVHWTRENAEVRGMTPDEAEAQTIVFREQLQEEAVDVAACALALYIKAGGKIDSFEKLLEKKNKKWENNIKGGTI